MTGYTYAQAGPGDGYLLKRSPEETCHGCHRTNLNTPSPGETGFDQATWDNSIKMHSAELLGTCSNTTYKTKTACEANSGTWTPGKWGASGGWGVTSGKYGEFKCTTCHTSHGTRNIFLIKETINTPDGGNWSSTGTPDATVDFRYKSGTAGSAPYVMGDDTGGHSTSTRVCEACHSQNRYHNYNTANNTGGLDHNNALDCNNCHSHKDAFAGLGGSCVDCHNGVPSGATYVTRDVVGSDFTQASRHVFNGTVTNWDCIVCHREGDETAATSGKVRLTSLHKNPGGIKVDLRDVDNPASTVVQWDKNNVTNTMLTGMDTFCMKCHDADGASGIAVATGDTGVTLTPSTSEALKPFNSTDGIDSGTGGGSVTVGVDLTSIYSDQASCEGKGFYWDGSLCWDSRGRVLDVESQFNPGTGGSGTGYNGNPSQHAVLGQRYSTAWSDTHPGEWDDPAWVNSTLKDGTNLQTVKETARLHCADCHTVDLNAHGGSNIFMLTGSTIDDTCWTCHSNATYSNSGASRNQSRQDHRFDGRVLRSSGVQSKVGNSYCLNCHAGNVSYDGWGAIHGIPSGNDPRLAQERYRFIGGSYMTYDGKGWNTTTQGTCYFASSRSQPFSNCNQHSGSRSGYTPNYGRDTKY